MDKDIITQRLAFIKYLYQIAVEQSYQSEPMNSASILSFHDSVELFLYLASEHWDCPLNNNQFMEYWETLKPKVDLSQKESMRRLNKCRVSLKHYGTMPSNLDIEAIRASINSFFYENCKIVFDMEFDDISMINLIECKEAKECLEEAKQYFKNSELLKAAFAIGKSFRYVIDSYKENYSDRFGRTLYNFGDDMTFNNSFFMGIEDKNLSEFIDKTRGSIQSIRPAVEILSLGLNYKKYIIFKSLTPIINKTMGGTYKGQQVREAIFSDEQFKFCVNFVIESALKLQSSNYKNQSMM